MYANLVHKKFSNIRTAYITEKKPIYINIANDNILPLTKLNCFNQTTLTSIFRKNVVDAT